MIHGQDPNPNPNPSGSLAEATVFSARCSSSNTASACAGVSGCSWASNAAVSGSVLSADLITNGDFEQWDRIVVSLDSNTWGFGVPTGWDFSNELSGPSRRSTTASCEAVEYHHSSLGRPMRSGNFYIELDGCQNQCVRQTVQLTGAFNYELRWSYLSRVGGPSSGMAVYLNGGLLYRHSGTPYMAWEDHSAVIGMTYTSEVTIEFCAEGAAEGFGAYLDFVSLHQVNEPVVQGACVPASPRVISGAAEALPPVCPLIYYFVEEGQFLHGSLVAPKNINTDFHNTLFYTLADVQRGVTFPGCGCEGCSTDFALGSTIVTHHTPTPAGYTPEVGAFTLSSAGLFTYIHVPDGSSNYNKKAVWNGYDAFSYSASCVSGSTTTSCSGFAFIRVVFTSASTRNNRVGIKNADFGAAPFVNFVKCTGNCRNNADDGMLWFARQTLPRVWDVMSKEDGTIPQLTIQWNGVTKDTDAVEFKWSHNFATLISYGAIGNMGVRFPTMEEVTFTPGQLFRASDYGATSAHPVSHQSTGFDLSCLDNQNTNAGGDSGYALWHKNGDSGCTTTEGCFSNSYLLGQDLVSWYSKFNGKHTDCDIFETKDLSCSRAPLLSPVANVVDDDYEARGIWRLTVDNCLLKWEGRFTWNALNTQTLSNGNKAWHLTTANNEHKLTGNVYNEAVQPNSWTDLARGFAWIDRRYLLTIILKQEVDFQFELGIDIFTVDLQHFTYRTQGGDRAFGYNMIVYPLTLNSGFSTTLPAANYPDRRIRGLVWVSQFWYAPACPAPCNKDGFRAGAASTNQCAAPVTANSVFDAATMPAGDCASPLVDLIKGPASGNECDQTFSPLSGGDLDPMVSIRNVRGVSPQNPSGGNCATNFQNITIRGIATGSNGLDESATFGFEGTIVLEFLLVNGEHPHMQLTPKMYVHSISVNGGFAGTSYTCRGSPFWPVAVPNGNTLPTYLCEEVDARTFGPTDWAIIFFDITDVDAHLVTLKSLYIQLGTLTVTFYTEGTEDSTFWYPAYGYFNFRNLKALAGQSPHPANLLSAPSYPSGFALPPQKTDFGFAFTPGAHNENTKITIYCTLSIAASTSGPSRRFGAQQQSPSGDNKIQESIQINKQATSSSLVGVSSIGSSSVTSGSATSSSSSSNVVVTVLAVACGLLIVAVIGMAVFILKRPAVEVKRVSSSA